MPLNLVLAWIALLISTLWRLAPGPAAPPPPTGWELNVPVVAQAYNLSCEAASLQMVLAYEGDDVAQSTLLALMRPDHAKAALTAGRVTGWSDPYANFVGDPSGHEYNFTGYGVYYPVVARVAAQLGREVVWSGTGMSWAELRRQLEAGHPAVAWVAFNGIGYGRSGPFYSYTAWDGRQVPFAPGYEHAVVVAGIREDAVLLDNPHGGFRQWLPKPTFLSAFAVFGEMAVVVG